ncbi:hypothetical protein D3C74_365520 [compost metagenome]
MLRRDKGQLHRAYRHFLPPLHFQAVHKAFAHHLALQPHRHHKRSSRLVQLTYRSEMQMIVMGMGDQDQIHRGNPAERNAGLSNAFLKAEPPGPYRIGYNIYPFILKQKSGMTDPGNGRIQTVLCQIIQLRRVIRYFIGVILLLHPPFLAPLAELFERFICTDIVDVIVAYSGH